MSDEIRALAHQLGLLKPCDTEESACDSCGLSMPCCICNGSGERLPTLDEVLDELERRGVLNPVFDRDDDRYSCSEPDVDGYGWCMREPCGKGPTRLAAVLHLLKEIARV